MSRTREVVERYNLELWNKQRYEIAPEIIGEQVVRNSPGRRDVLSHAEAVERIRKLWATVEHVEFTLLHTIVDDDLCTIVYQADIAKSRRQSRRDRLDRGLPRRRRAHRRSVEQHPAP